MKKEDMFAPFDTLAAYDRLKEVFTEEQARVIVRVMVDAFKDAFEGRVENNESKDLSSKKSKILKDAYPFWRPESIVWIIVMAFLLLGELGMFIHVVMHR